jgi:acetaldehyde dehydrogenase (acetylating)
MDKDLQAIQQARDLVEKAFETQKAYADFSQESVNAIVHAMSRAGLREAERLARLAVEETGFGKVEDKILKNRFGAETVYDAIKDLKTAGVIREDHAKGLVEIAAPVGVIAAIIPSTNPTSTTIYKALISLKSRNSIVFSPHPSAVQCVLETARVLMEAARNAGAPDGVIQCMSVPTLEGTQELMKHRKTALILATGGLGLVRAAYSAGKPAYGVGPGNVPAYIESSANIPKAVSDVLAGKCFDNGTLCCSEQALVTDEAIKGKVMEEVKAQGGYFLSDAEIEALSKIVVTPTHSINPQIVGRAATVIAGMAGIQVSERTRVLLARLKGVGRDFPLSIEKLSPILAFYVEKNWQAACDRCIELLSYGGLGHTLAIHSQNEDIIRQFGLYKPASRIVVNTQSSLGAVGYTTNLFPSMTLGCGTLGGNITSDNISPLHLINVKRIAYCKDSLQQSGRAPAALSAGQPSCTTETPGRAVRFVCEEDVRNALAKGEKIYVNSKSVITPSARDLAGKRDIIVFIS